MKLNIVKTLALFFFGLFTSFNVMAVPVNWTVDAFLEFGGTQETLTGTFTYDTDTFTLSNVNLSIADLGGTELFHYTFGQPRIFSETHEVQFFDADLTAGGDLTGVSWLALGFNTSEPLSYVNALGVFPLTSFVTDPGFVVQSSRSQCANAACAFPTTVFTLATSGTLEGNAVPIPAAIWLFASGILGLLGITRRNR